MRLLRPGKLVIGLAIGAAALWSGCKPSATQPAGPDLVAKADLTIFSLPSSDPAENVDGSCQTGGQVQFDAWNTTGESHDPGGNPVSLEWHFIVDRGFGPETPPDWGGPHVFVNEDYSKAIQERSLTVNLYTIGTHEVTLTVRARDGRKASTKLRMLVTACEDCGE